MLVGPIVFAFGAGMVATVNPCGFALLPAYAALLLADTRPDTGRTGVVAGLRVGAVITVAFVLTFSVVGIVIRFVSDAFVDAIPWAVIVIALGLVVAGVAVLIGRHVPIPVIQMRSSRKGSFRSMAVFGVAYAVASVSCTLPIFLAVITAAATAATVPEGMSVFVAYGLGMGSVLVALTVAIATSRDAVVRRMRGLAPYVERFGGWLLVASGLFVAYYWLTVLTVDITSNNSLTRPIVIIDRFSAWFTAQITQHTLAWSIGLLTLVLSIGIYEVWRARRR